MRKIVKRGYFFSDERDFNQKSLPKLYQAAYDYRFLLNREYSVKSALTFVGNHYLLSERQRLSLMRGISSKKDIESRKSKQITNHIENRTVHIDGFNTIITLEVALSQSLLLKCMDGTIRDLAALRGSYRVIDKTEHAIMCIGEVLQQYHIDKVVFYLDAPVSNSGRLKTQILELLSVFDYDIEINVINDVDRVLQNLENVITSDAIILDKCQSWINLNKTIIKQYESQCFLIDFENAEQLK
ncbi:DUF434 domain-containing protein [Lachnospiraceae bacterium 46-61]